MNSGLRLYLSQVRYQEQYSLLLQPLKFDASPIETDGTIAKVDFYNGSTLLSSDNTSPYSITLSNVPVGNYTITAIATNNTGGSTTSAPVTVVVVSNQSPVVSISGPVSGTVFTAPASITITASATDADGTIAKVDFYNGSTLLGSDNTSPYSFTLSNIQSGSYTITAKATDNAGASNTSTPVTVEVVSHPLPVVSILSPVSGAIFNPPASITIAASATESAGSITKVDFYLNNGNTLLGSDNTSPYSYTVTNLPIGSYTITAKATDNTGVSTISNPVAIEVVSNQSPVVSISSPVSGAFFTPHTSVTIVASATDADGTIAKVDFYNGSTLLSSDNTSPYSYTVTDIQTGNYTLTAKATDDDGASTISTPVTIVVMSNQSPVVSISSPISGAIFTPHTSVTIVASATDADGTIAKVDFYNGRTLLGSDNTSPYSYTVTNIQTGSYTITAKATDNAGASTTGTPVTIVVVPNQSPVVSISNPVSGAIFTAPASITIVASTTDSDGTIAKVDFYNGSKLLSTDYTSPYSYIVTKIPAGNYTITAKVTDNDGASTTSIPVNILVVVFKSALLVNSTSSDELLTTTNVETANCAIMIPNGFSPDGDGINDYFKIIALKNILMLNYKSIPVPQ